MISRNLLDWERRYQGQARGGVHYPCDSDLLRKEVIANIVTYQKGRKIGPRTAAVSKHARAGLRKLESLGL
jgi:hypothetical protein